MRLVSFLTEDGIHLGAVIENNMVDLKSAYEASLQVQGDTFLGTNESFPRNMVEFIAEGEPSLKRAQNVISFAREASGQFLIPYAEVELTTPIVNPPKILCLGACPSNPLAFFSELVGESTEQERFTPQTLPPRW